MDARRCFMRSVVSHLGLVWVLELWSSVVGWLLCASGIFVRASARAAHRAEGTRNDINQGCLPVNGRCGPLMLCPLAHAVGSWPRIRAFIIVAVGRGPTWPPTLPVAPSPRPSACSRQTKGSLTNRLRFVDWLSELSQLIHRFPQSLNSFWQSSRPSLSSC